MVFDLRPYVTLDPEEAQLNEDGGIDVNRWNNCGPAMWALIFRWLGNGDPFEPEQITAWAYGPSYVGGEISARILAFFQAHAASYPHFPYISITSGDVIDSARAAGAQGFPTCNWWHCDTAGNIVTYNSGHLHWSAIVYDDGASLGVWNIMRGQLVTLTYAQARAAYAGEFTTFELPLGGNDLDAAQAAELHNTSVEVTSGIGLRAMFAAVNKDLADIKAHVAQLDAIKASVDSLTAAVKAMPASASPDLSALLQGVNDIKSHLSGLTLKAA